MARFVGLAIDDVYWSSSHRIGKNLYGMLLPNATRYSRAAGFFSSTAFRVASDDFLAFFKRGCRMDLVCSQWLGAADLEAMSCAVFDRPQVRASLKLEDMGSLANQVAPWPELVSCLIANDLLRVRIAITQQPGQGSLYHEKIGFFSDDEGRIVSYSGRANESRNGLETNFEHLDVYASWGQGKKRRRALTIQQQFRNLWSNRKEGLEIVDLATALRKGLLRKWEIASETDTQVSAETFEGSMLHSASEVLVPPADITLFAHQSEAIRSWAKAGRHGVLEMATGSGKTITGLSLASRLYDGAGSGLTILIVAPLIHLVDQWREVAKPGRVSSAPPFMR